MFNGPFHLFLLPLGQEEGKEEERIQNVEASNPEGFPVNITYGCGTAWRKPRMTPLCSVAKLRVSIDKASLALFY